MGNGMKKGGGPPAFQMDFARGMEALTSLENSYNFLETDSVKQFLVDNTIEEIIVQLIECIETRDATQFHIVMAILQEEWTKVKRDPFAYE